MISQPVTIEVLLVEDDPESLDQLKESLPKEIDDHQISWTYCQDFDSAIDLVRSRRFDLVVTDIWEGTPAGPGSNVDPSNARAVEIITAIRGARFCPILVFTSGTRPESIELGVFLGFADKSRGDAELVEHIRRLIATGVPHMAGTLHDDLDRATGSYLWEFLSENWDQLTNAGLTDRPILERLVRRRAALQLSRLQPGADTPIEIERVEGGEYYIYPPISGDVLRLGDILRQGSDGQFRVVLTPHCHLVVQPSQIQPRADYILMVKALRFEEVIAKEYPAAEGRNAWTGNEQNRLETLRRRTQIPADLGRPRERYCFLPRFLDIPDLLCDLLQFESVPYSEARETIQYQRVVTLDTPFAEALQAAFLRFYSAVGIPSLDPSRFTHLTT